MSFSPKDKHKVIFTAPPVKRTCCVSHCCLSLRSTLCLKLSQIKGTAKWFNTIAPLDTKIIYFINRLHMAKMHQKRRTYLQW